LGGININDYATRKTIAQGMLDLALLTANAAQLKRIMTIGNSHRFYYLLMTLILISICLQVGCTFSAMARVHTGFLKSENDTFQNHFLLFRLYKQSSCASLQSSSI
jgi:hypothetical protein